MHKQPWTAWNMAGVAAALFLLPPVLSADEGGVLVPPVSFGGPWSWFQPLSTGCGGAAPTATNAAYEQQVVELVNKERKTQGLPPMKLVTALSEAARYHSKDMADDDYFDHDTYDRSGVDLVFVCDTWARLNSFYTGWNGAAENIAAGQSSPESVMSAWMNSPGHRANILSSLREIGVGYWAGGSYGRYWVQDFGTRPDVYPLVIRREAALTRNRSVSLYLYGAWSEMRLRNDQEAFGPWRPFSNSVPWTLADTNGTRTVTAEVRSGATTESASDSITLERSVRGDFDGDATSDILWRHTSGALYQWRMNGALIASSGTMPTVTANWLVAGLGDFNGDGATDILWRDSGSGATYVWLMNGLSISGQGFTALQADSSWAVQGVGDFDGDDQADILWRHTGGALYIWQMNGIQVASASYLPPISTAWQVKDLGDVDGDGRADIIWRETASGSTYVWFMDGATTLASGYTSAAAQTSWTVQGVGDLDGDGKDDVIWRHTSGALYVWLMDGQNVRPDSALLPAISLSWQIRQLGDFDGDGRTDILWRETTSGSTYVWLMEGTATVGSGYTSGQADSTWTIQAR
jgi:uncharacterized protein YkwD